MKPHIFLTQRTSVSAATLLAACLLLVGCGSSPSSISSGPPPYDPPTGNFAGLPFTGKAMAGNLPLVGASVQVYTAGTSGNGSASTQLFSDNFVTANDGSFTVATNYTCPAANSILYVVVRGGMAGANGVTNTGTTLVSTLGPCQTLTGNPAFVVSEITTVVTAYAMAQFMSAGAMIGASATNTIGITNAAATVASLVNLTTGTMPGASFPTTGTAPIARINTLANLLNACIVTSAAGCTQLYTLTASSGQSTSNTLDALLSIAKNPSLNVGAIFTATRASQVYAPALTAAPSDWTMFTTYKGGGMSLPTALAIDSKGEVWVANYNGVASLFSNTGTPEFANGITGYGLGNSYGLAVDTEDNAWITNAAGMNLDNGSVTELTTSGKALSGTYGYSQGGIFFPIAILIDTTGTTWVVNNGQSDVTQLNNFGTSQAGTSGIVSPLFGAAVAIAFNSKHEAFVANQAYDTVTTISSTGSPQSSVSCCDMPAAIAVDQSDNVWITNADSNSVAQLNAGGQIVSSGYSAGGLDSPSGIAIDGGGNVWIGNYHGNSITELAGSQASSPGKALSPQNGYGTDAGINATYGIAIDASGNVWITNGNANTITQFLGLAAPVKMPLIGVVAAP